MSSLTTIWAIAQIVLGISFLIVVHELGHFLVARWCGVRCETFSIGFGPKIFAWKGRQTEYRLCWILLGGYVKMAGEQPGEGTPGAPDDLQSQSVGARAAIFAAGVTMNLIFAVVLFAIAFGLGVRFVHPEVGDVPAGTPAWHAGLEPGDRIVAIDGKEILNFDQIALSVAFADPKRGMELRLERKGQTLTRRVHPEYHEAEGLQWIGVLPASRATIDVKKGSPAWKAGLRTGDRLLAINGHQPIESNRDLLDALSGVTGNRVQVVHERDGKRHEATLETGEIDRWVLGVIQAGTVVADVRRRDPADEKADSAAARAGVRPGDRLVSLGGEVVHSLRKAKDRVRQWPAAWGAEVPVVLLRGEDGKSPSRVSLVLRREGAAAFLDSLAPRVHDPVVGEVQAGLPAEKAGIAPGSRILELDGTRIASWPEMAQIIQRTAGKPFTLRWQDPAGKQHERKVSAARVNRVAGEIGLGYDFKLSPEVRYGLGQACLVGIEHSMDMALKVVLMLKALFTRQVSPTKLGGPILIAQASYAYIDRFGFARFLYFLGLLSVNLVILNLLPIPILDGGHLMFLGIEAVKGAPVSETTLAISHYIGFFLILALIVFVMFNDILRIFS